MRIPTSTIVMTLLTCVPFGLAIRDSLRTKADLPDEDAALLAGLGDEDTSGDSAEAERKRLAEFEAQEAEQAAADKLAHDKVRARMLGPAPATLGPAFGGIAIGAPTDDAAELAATNALDEGGMAVTFEHVNEHVTAILIESTASCSDFAEAVEAKWGANDSRRWIDAASSSRAKLDECMLRLEKFVDAQAWVKALPLPAIGKPAAAFRDQLGLLVTDEDEVGFTWHDLGPGPAGDGNATYDAYTKNGKLIGFSASATVDAVTGEVIRVQLDKQYGAPKTDPDTGFSVYKSRPQITVDGHSGQITLQAGTLP